MKFSKIVLLPLLALGLAACQPVAPSGSTSEVPATSETQPSESKPTTPEVATDWDEETKAMMEKQLGYIIPFFPLDGMWGTDEQNNFMFISNPELNVTKEAYFGDMCLGLLQGGMVDSTYKYSPFIDKIHAEMPGTTAFVLSHVDVGEGKNPTVLKGIVVWYFEANAMGAGSLGTAMITTSNVTPEIYENKELKDTQIQEALVTAFGENHTLNVPSLEMFDGKLPYVDLFADKDYFQLMLGYCASLDNLETIVKLFTEAGWKCNGQGEEPYDFYIGYNIVDGSEDVPTHQVLIRIMPDMAILVGIVPFEG